MAIVLIVGKEKTTISILTKLLKTEGYKVNAIDEPEKIESALKTDDVKLVMSFVGPAWDSDLSIVGNICQKKGNIPLIVIGDNEEYVNKAQQFTPYAVFEKPLKIDKLILTVQRAVDFYEAEKSKKVNLGLLLETSYPFENIVAESPLMRSMCDMIMRVAGIDVTVLITGEPGTGKQEIARTIHDNSKRKGSQMMVFDCAAPNADERLFGSDSEKGFLENADKCTLFLRNIESLPLETQDKLGKALTDKKVSKTKPDAGAFDARVIASCEANLEQLVVQLKFSANLFRIVRVIHIKVPPLRDRKADIRPIVRRFIIKNTPAGQPVPSVDKVALEHMENYQWPKNISELEAVLLVALKQVKNGVLEVSSLPLPLQSA